MNLGYPRTILALFASFFVLTNNCFAQKEISKVSKEKAQQIDELFSSWNDSTKPGAAISIIKDGELIYGKGYGSANLEYSIPIHSNTIFHAASLSKQFTAFAILLLEADGKLSIQDDVRKYIPELPDFGEVITLEKMASHSSGLKDQWRLLEMAGWRLDDVITQEQILRLVSRQKSLNFKPGDEHMYSNTGFTLLAEIVKRVSGKSFKEFTKERIFQPLDMENTQFYDDHEEIVYDRAYSYYKTEEKFKKKVLSFSNVGPTSLFTTAEDLAKWALNFENPKIGDSAIIEKLNTPPALNNGEVVGYALGQIRGTYQGLNVFVHSGSDAGYRAYFARLPDYNMSIAVLANVSEMNPIEQVFGVVNLYLSENFESSDSHKERDIFVPDPKSIISLSREQLEKHTGEYWEPIEGYKRKIYIKNDTLIYYRNKNSETKLVPIDTNKFKMLGDTENVTLVFNTNQLQERNMQVIINDDKPLMMIAYTDVNTEEYIGDYHSEELGITYHLMIKDEKLFITHKRLKDIELLPIKHNFLLLKIETTRR